MSRSITVAVVIGVLGGFWFALLNDSIEVFENYVDGAWRYQVVARSFAALIVGAVIGALAGANIHLALSQECANGFVRGALIGSVVGALIVLAQIVFVAIAANFGDYRLSYQPLLTRLIGILFVASTLGAALGAYLRNRPPVGLLPGALVGALVGVSFTLPTILAIALFISSLLDASYLSVNFILTYILPDVVSPLVGAASGAVVGAARRATPTSVIAAATVAVIASSVSFLYIIGLAFLHISFAPAVYAIRILVGMLAGIAVGFIIIAAARQCRDLSSQS